MEEGTHDELIRKKGYYWKLYTNKITPNKNYNVAFPGNGANLMS